MSRNPRGFTVIELLVVAVLGALLLAASYQVLITNQRTYTAQNAHIEGQQISRAALQALAGEIRELNPMDLVNMGTEQVTFRAQRRFGLVCGVTLPILGTSPVLEVRGMGDVFESGDSVTVYADNQEATPTDDEWLVALASIADPTGGTCDGDPVQRLTFTGQSTAFLADTVKVGAPVRSFVHYTYGLLDVSGESYVGRRVEGGDAEPLVGPLPPTFSPGVPSVEFTYLDGSGAVTTVAADVRQIEIGLRIRSDARSSTGERVADSLSTRVNLRN